MLGRRPPTTLLLALAGAAVLTTTVAAARGDLDPSFGSGGKVVTDFGGVEMASAAALQRDRKLVAAGSGFPASVRPIDFALARYNADNRSTPASATAGRS